MVKGWSKLKAHFKTDYRHIPAGEFHEAVSILARHVAEWELVDDTPKPAKQPTVQEIVADWVKKIEATNGYPAFLFQPLVDAVLRKSGKRLAVVARGQMVVDRRNSLLFGPTLASCSPVLMRWAVRPRISRRLGGKITPSQHEEWPASAGLFTHRAKNKPRTLRSGAYLVFAAGWG